MKASKFQWTDEAVATLTRMWDTHSRSVIANELGCSRNAVIGKGLRIGLPKTRPGGGTPKEGVTRRRRIDTGKPRVKPNGVSRFFRAPKVKAQPVEKAPPTLPESLSVSICEIPVGGCKFAVTGHDVSAEQHRFCGVKTSGVYCPYHANIAYTPYADRRGEKRIEASSRPGRRAPRYNEAWS